MAATPLGRDEHGKNLVAYIVRTDEEAPRFVPSAALANGNDPEEKLRGEKLKAALVDEKNKDQKTKNSSSLSQQALQQASARFITPDHLLSPRDQAAVDQLRSRDAAVKDDADALEENSAEIFLTSFVYGEGPDGKRYALGVSAPLITQKYSKASESKNNPSPPPDGTENINIRAALAYRSSYYSDAQGPRAGLLDRSL